MPSQSYRFYSPGAQAKEPLQTFFWDSRVCGAPTCHQPVPSMHMSDALCSNNMVHGSADLDTDVQLHSVMSPSID